MNSEIERMAKEAGLTLRNGVFTSYYVDGVIEDDLAKFAALVAEECAKEADPLRCADAIRAKFALSHKTPEAK